MEYLSMEIAQTGNDSFPLNIFNILSQYLYYIMNIPILLAALGITLLEMSEASAVGIALYAEQKEILIFLAIAISSAIVLTITAIAGDLLTYFPIFYVRLISATLLLYFGIRLFFSARRSVKFQKYGPPKNSHEETGKSSLLVTAFSVGAVESFEAAIVLVALFPQSYNSTLEGLFAGVIIVVIAAYILRSQVRKVKQAILKILVSSLLLTFSVFWYLESVTITLDIYLVPIFAVVFLTVNYLARRGI
jgi:uncharacterized membrane protein